MPITWVSHSINIPYCAHFTHVCLRLILTGGAILCVVSACNTMLVSATFDQLSLPPSIAYTCDKVFRCCWLAQVCLADQLGLATQAGSGTVLGTKGPAYCWYCVVLWLLCGIVLCDVCCVCGAVLCVRYVGIVVCLVCGAVLCVRYVGIVEQHVTPSLDASPNQSTIFKKDNVRTPSAILQSVWRCQSNEVACTMPGPQSNWKPLSYYRRECLQRTTFNCDAFMEQNWTKMEEK